MLIEAFESLKPSGLQGPKGKDLMSFCLSFSRVSLMWIREINKITPIGPIASWEIQPIKEEPKRRQRKREGRKGGKLKLTSVWLQEKVLESSGELRSNPPSVLSVPYPTVEKASNYFKKPYTLHFGGILDRGEEPWNLSNLIRHLERGNKEEAAPA